MELHSISLTLLDEQREQAQVLSPFAFRSRIAAHGFTVVRTSSVYTDREVLRQQWLVTPDGTQYNGHSFYRLFGTTSFRKFLRYVLSHTPFLCGRLESYDALSSTRTAHLTFLRDQGWLTRTSFGFERGQYQAHISNIGRTLEWYVAEWFRLTYSIEHLVPVRHGVYLAELPIPGDLDVVACLDEERIVMVECKSGTDADAGHFLRFLLRVQAFRPTLAILLMDIQGPFSPERIATFNTALQTLAYPPLRGERGFYRGPMNVYFVNVEYSIATSLNDVLTFHR